MSRQAGEPRVGRRGAGVRIECVYQDLALVNGLSIYPQHVPEPRACCGAGRSGSSTTRRCAAGPPSARRDRRASRRSISRSGNSRAASARRSRWRARSVERPHPPARRAARGDGRARGAAIIDLIDRLKARGDIAIVMIAHNYAQTLEICDRVMLVQHGEITFESKAATTSAEELLEIVRREYRPPGRGDNSRRCERPSSSTRPTNTNATAGRRRIRHSRCGWRAPAGSIRKTQSPAHQDHEAHDPQRVARI